MIKQTTTFKIATINQLDRIWELIQDGIALRKAQGSMQWQNGYPNRNVIKQDIEEQAGFVLLQQDTVIGYMCLKVNNEPQYENIKGKWLSKGDFLVIHRVVISKEKTGSGFAKELMFYAEDYARSQQISSIKADTNFDNVGMLRLFDIFEYTYCGELVMNGQPRKGFEKIIL